MRLNTPVVDKEFPFPPGETLVSTTDLKGRITYCNPAFILVSGYQREELLGQPHNMIRHPDMPEEAFRDMWQTIEAGLPWSALVKNRRKDGTYYWVKANVTPLMEGDHPVGYMSVRTAPTRADVEAAEALYRTMRSEAQAGRLVHTLSGGHLHRNDLSGRLRRLTRLGLTGKLVTACGTACALSFLLGTQLGSAPAWQTALGLLASVTLLTAPAAWVVTQLAVSPLDKLLDFSNRMAAGDLTSSIEVTRNDVFGKFGNALNQLNVNLRSIVRDARTEVEQMLLATREIAEGNQDLSSRTESQASSLQQTAASMEQITGTVKTSSDTASQAATLAQQTTEVTQRTSAAVGAVTNTMQGIEESSRRIAEIIQVIDSIAFQTNILALNAAVEAARAGEQGRGFAVVAAEVRALAGRTATAAKEVKHLITDSAEKVEAGSRITSAAQHTMDEALHSVQGVNHLVESISHGAHEQLSGISQINQAVAQLDSITQQNAAAVEQIAAASMALASRAKVVAETVQVFRLDDGPQRALPDAVALRKAHKATAQNAQAAAPMGTAAAPRLSAAPVARQPAPHSALSMADGDWESH
ncbi:MAG: hypothetical protein RLZZ182_1664 [Pseudomonadota bacterium]|jgi:aerotaxis receptor